MRLEREPILVYSCGFILLFCALCCAGAGAALLKKSTWGIYPAFLRAVLRWFWVLGSGLLRGSGVGAASLVSGAGLGAGPRWWFGAGWFWLFLFSGGSASGAASGFRFLLVCGCFLAACAGRCVCVSFLVRVFFVWRAPGALRVRCCGGPARVFFLVLDAGAVRAPAAWRAFVFFCGARCASARVAAVLVARVFFFWWALRALGLGCCGACGVRVLVLARACAGAVRLLFRLARLLLVRGAPVRFGSCPSAAWCFCFRLFGALLRVVVPVGGELLPPGPLKKPATHGGAQGDHVGAPMFTLACL